MNGHPPYSRIASTRTSSAAATAERGRGVRQAGNRDDKSWDQSFDGARFFLGRVPEGETPGVFRLDLDGTVRYWNCHQGRETRTAMPVAELLSKCQEIGARCAQSRTPKQFVRG